MFKYRLELMKMGMKDNKHNADRHPKLTRQRARLIPGIIALLTLMALSITFFLAKADAPNIVVDANSNLGAMNHFWAGIGFMDLHQHMDPNTDEYTGDQALFDLIKEVNQSVPGTFTYMRFFDLLSDSGKWRDGVEFPLGCVSLQPERNFALCDQYFDRILDMGVKPLAILAFTPKELVSDESLWSKAFTGANVSPPDDYNAWRNLVRDVVAHFKQRYGEEEVRQWIWEVWNEPDLAGVFWPEEKYCGGIAYTSNWPVADRCFSDSDCHGSKCITAISANWYPQGHMLEYTRLYDFTAEGLFSVSQDLQIAGPVTAGRYFEPLLMHLNGISISGNSSADPEGRNWATGQIGGGKINYISYHMYSADPADYADGMEAMYSELVAFDYRFGTNYRTYPRIISEYSPYTVSTTADVTRFVAAWQAGVVDGILERADQLGNPTLIPYHMNNLTTPVAKDFGDGNQEPDGFVTTIENSSEVVKLAIFNAYEALGHLNGIRLKDITSGSNIGSIASRETTNDGKMIINIIVYNVNPDDPECTSAATSPINLQINNLPFSSFTVEHYRIDHEHSDAYSLWRNGIRDISTLQGQDDLVQISGYPKQDTAQGDQYTLSFDLPSNGLSLIRLIGDASGPVYEDEDIDQDGQVNSRDLQLCINVFLKIEQDPIFIQRADVNKDGWVNKDDMLQVLNATLRGG